MIYKTFQKVSNVCQLLDKSKYPATQTINGVTFTNNGDGTITANGTATNEIYKTIESFGDSLYLSHKYLLTGENSGLYLFVENRDENNVILAQLKYNNISSLPSKTKKSTYVCYIKNGVVCDNLVIKPQLFDLTEMYGAGHEPTSVEQFRQDFPDEMYDYSPYCFVKSYKTLLKASGVCQLMDKSKYPVTQTIKGVTFTNNGDGTFTVNGTSTSGSGFRLDTFYIDGNRTYLMTGCPEGGGAGKYFMFDGYSKLGSDLGSGVIKTVSGSDRTLCSPILYVVTGQTVSNLVFKPQIFDLTEMYGAGNEPTTVQQFRQDFPEELYDYKPYSIITSHKRNLTCKTKNLFDIPLTRGYPSDTTAINTTLRTFTVGTYVVGMARNNYYNSNTIIDFIIDKNRIKLTVKVSGYGISIPLLLTVGNTYALSCKSDNNKYPSIGITYYKKDGTLISYSSYNEKITNTPEITFTVPENTYYTLILFYGREKNEYTFSNIQLELGDTATDYVPYGHL